jgi:hypothetical protein
VRIFAGSSLARILLRLAAFYGPITVIPSSVTTSGSKPRTNLSAAAGTVSPLMWAGSHACSILLRDELNTAISVLIRNRAVAMRGAFLWSVGYHPGLCASFGYL